MLKLSAGECKICVKGQDIGVLGYFRPKGHINGLLSRIFTGTEGWYFYMDYTSPDRDWCEIYYISSSLSSALFGEEFRNLRFLACGVLTENIPNFNYALKTTPKMFKRELFPGIPYKCVNYAFGVLVQLLECNKDVAPLDFIRNADYSQIRVKHLNAILMMFAVLFWISDYQPKDWTPQNGSEEWPIQRSPFDRIHLQFDNFGYNHRRQIAAACESIKHTISRVTRAVQYQNRVPFYRFLAACFTHYRKRRGIIGNEALNRRLRCLQLMLKKGLKFA